MCQRLTKWKQINDQENKKIALDEKETIFSPLHSISLFCIGRGLSSDSHLQ